MLEIRATVLLFRSLKQQQKYFSTVSNGFNVSIHFRNPVLFPILATPSRSTIIVKRIYPVRLHKEGSKPRIEKLNYLYDVVEDTDFKTEPTIDVVLTSYVQGVGNAGDIVSMKRTSAYNRLLVTGKGVLASEESLEYARNMKKDAVAQDKQVSPSVEFLLEFLKKKCVTVVMNKENEWTIEPWHIRSSFKKNGIHIHSDSQIELPSKPIKGPNMDYQDKDFYVKLTINKKHTTKVRCRIHHWGTSPLDRIPLNPHPWSAPLDHLFPEDDVESTENPTSSGTS